MNKYSFYVPKFEGDWGDALVAITDTIFEDKIKSFGDKTMQACADLIFIDIAAGDHIRALEGIEDEYYEEPGLDPKWNIFFNALKDNPETQVSIYEMARGRGSKHALKLIRQEIGDKLPY
ncbi:MAG: hypothetical protein AAF821_18275 [Cyanobacteria bacterium P01_D01_bin.156]